MDQKRWNSGASKRKTKKENEAREAVLLQSVPLIANFFQNPSDNYNDDSSTIVSCDEGTSISSVSSNVVTPPEPSFEGKPSTANDIQEPSFPPQEWLGSSQESNQHQAIPGAM